jgi:tetratricopeptide (TPR) repeat protein
VVFQIHLQSTAKRVTLLVVTALAACLLMWWTLLNFVLNVVTDPRVQIPTDTLLAAAEYFPSSGSVQGRLAARLLEVPLAEGQDENAMLSQAGSAAERAASLLPRQYENHLLLATVKERQADWAAAEQAIQKALELAPHHVEVHWRAGNFWLRADKLEPALKELRAVALTDPPRAPQIYSLLWDATDGQPDTLRRLAEKDDVLKVGAAQFLLSQERVNEALQLFRQADLTTRRTAPQSPAFLNELIAQGKVVEAQTLWLDVMGKASEPNRIWNGGFENPPRDNFRQFDWVMTSNQYAQIGRSADRAHSGQYALKVIFTGVDTTRLSENIHQLVTVRPGAKYQLEAYFLTTDLKSSEPVNLVVKRADANTPLALSPALKAGGDLWQIVRFEFVAPADVTALKIEMQRLPRFSYDAPTTGTIWFDDLSLREL